MKRLQISNELREVIQSMIDTSIENNNTYLINNKMYKTGIFAPNNDLDNAISDGCYSWDIETLHRPTSNYGTIFTMVSTGISGNNQNNWVNQLAMDTARQIWFRQKINASAWTSWSKIL